MEFSVTYIGMLQTPFTVPFQEWLDGMTLIFNLGYAMAIRGYFLLLLIGFMIYVTGLSDTLSKALVVAGVVLYIAGPPVINLFAGMAGIGVISVDEALATWMNFVGISDAEFIHLLIMIGGILLSVCGLSGAILYFTPASSDLKARGQSLIVRALILAPVLAFFQLVPWM